MLNDITSFEWLIPDIVKVDEDAITTINSRGIKYKPFESYFKEREFRLYIEFSKAKTLEDVEDFIRTYGVLGLDTMDTAERLEFAESTIKKALASFRDAIEPFAEKLTDINKNDITNEVADKIVSVYRASVIATKTLIEYQNRMDTENELREKHNAKCEYTEVFLTEAKVMDKLLWLNSIDFKENYDLKLIWNVMHETSKLIKAKDQSKELYKRGVDFDFSQVGDKQVSDLHFTQWSTKAFIASAISLQLEATYPSLDIQYNKSKWFYEYTSSYRPKTLLGAMYIMFYLDLIKGNRIILCDVCHQPLLIVDDRNKRMHKKCVSRFNTRQSREQEKRTIALYKAGKSIDEIYQIINQSKERGTKVEQIKKWIKRYEKKGGK